MVWKKCLMLMALSLFLAVLAGCTEDDGEEGAADAGGEAAGDADIDADTDADADADGGTGDTDTDTTVDTEGFEPEACGDEWYPEEVDYDYGDDYAEGPYGFKGSLCWDMEGNSGSYRWGGAGDTVHDLCLPNHEDEEVCLSQFFRSERDLLILDFSAGW